jgi:hypothetical protein
MISRRQVSRGRTSASASVLGVLVCVLAALALSATPALACPNEQLRKESNADPSPAAEGKSYSSLLPDCRAYEMVSPLDKQEHDAQPFRSGIGIPVAPGGETVGFQSEGDFAGAENFSGLLGAHNDYLSQRSKSGWITSSMFAPASLIRIPAGLSPGAKTEGEAAIDTAPVGELSPDLRSTQVSCGAHPASAANSTYGAEGLVCVRCPSRPALGCAPSAWTSTPTFTASGGGNVEEFAFWGGSSPELSRLFIQPRGGALLSSDTVVGVNQVRGIYEVTWVGTQQPTLRLASVDNSGTELGVDVVSPTKQQSAALVGDSPVYPEIGQEGGSAYHAISKSGERVFFTARPAGGGVQTLYARIHCEPGSSPECHEDGNNEWLETIAVSDPSPSECSACKPVTEPKELKAATFQGASADGSKVFFTTEQSLLSKEENAGAPVNTRNLYEYELNAPEGKKLVLLSPDKEEAEVEGVVRTSSDGSHVYFVASGVLTTEKNAEGESAQPGKNNVYGYDTVAQKIKFITSTGAPTGNDTERAAQTTPDGNYFVFSSTAKLAGDANASAQAVYRYDFETGELTWISHGAAGFKSGCEAELNAKHEPKSLSEKEKCEHEGRSAFVAPLPDSGLGAEPSIDDWNRAISGESNVEAPGKTPDERHDGEYIIFTTTERLQAQDENNATDVYGWHCPSPCPKPATEGTVSMISDGHDPNGVNPPPGTTQQRKAEGTPVTAISSSGSDIFFFTHTRLVGQDEGVLSDLYDARVGGGFEAPPIEPHCAGEACQGGASPVPSFGSAASSSSPAGGNLVPALGGALAFKTLTPKPLTQAQKLANALKTCKKERKKKQRVACESQARKKYPSKAKSKKKVKAKKSTRRSK